MNFLIKHLKSIQKSTISILDPAISIGSYCAIDLSASNVALTHLNIQDSDQCQAYITSVLDENKAKVAYGGYLEKRNLYSDKASFSQTGNERNIHLGVDFWTKAGTKVVAPLAGEVHSFQNNATLGDYGPTIILLHHEDGMTFYTLYGHLAMKSLKNLYVGLKFQKGATLATLGTLDINVNYAPHLHFQIIGDMEGKKGDYPGVCSANTLAFYAENCPDPNILLKTGR